VDDYAFVDAGDGTRLERFGHLVVARPHPAATGPRHAPGSWDDAGLRFDRDRGWSGADLDAARDGWVARLADLEFELRPTQAGQVGLFPEHAALLPWLDDRVVERAGRPVAVLNLFAYTGLVTLALARAGTTVAHVDAARPSIAWARRNAARNDLAGRPIRWLVDDARGFVAREVRRGRRYDGIVLDPPTYGHGTTGRAWRLERDLEPLLADVTRLLAPVGFILLTAHAEGLDPDDLGDRLAAVTDHVETGHLRLTAESGAVLDLGAFARSGGAS
jgi:23S rRNA (cytosine1962-C5)-methyltransferase